ncbi:MAG: DUF1292 domain-containing protein [Lachnospiraceae bacterium]|nr:DUF1292 domain-containing protein [Lachnospiraceae bacterium]
MENYEEYIVFTDTTSDGKEIELAVIDDFEVDGNSYVVAGLVEGDTISDDGVFLYKVKAADPDFEVEKIATKEEYEKVAKAYAEI